MLCFKVLLLLSCIVMHVTSNPVKGVKGQEEEQDYVPMMEKGICSWYGSEAHGHYTASGDRFNMFNMTAAHRTLPFGSQIQVVNLRNKRSIHLTITDRGPFVYDRILDMSWAGARKLGFINQGLTKCKLIVL